MDQWFGSFLASAHLPEHSSGSMDFIVDIQGFKRSLNKFVFKEVAIVSLEDDSLPTVFHFEPPYHWRSLLAEHKSCNRWLARNFHGMLWDSGDIPYEKLEETLDEALKDARKIYVKGYEKRCWLSEILPHKLIGNLEVLDCPSIRKLPKDPNITCNFHCMKWQAVCAVQNAQALKSWLLENRRETSKIQSEMLSALDECTRLSYDVAEGPEHFRSMYN